MYSRFTVIQFSKNHAYLRPAPCYLPVSLAGPEPSGLNHMIKQASKNVNPQNKIFLNSRNPQYTGDITTSPLTCEKESKLFSKKNNKNRELCLRALEPPGIEGAQIELCNKKIGQETRENGRKAKETGQEHIK